MFFISVVPVDKNHVFMPCSARVLSSAKSLATKSCFSSGMKAAVAFAADPASKPFPLAEIVYREGCAWQSLFPSSEPVGLHHD
jgi:hypothetical protein